MCLRPCGILRGSHPSEWSRERSAPSSVARVCRLTPLCTRTTLCRLSLLHGATKEKETKEPCVAVGGLGLLSRRSGSNRRSRAADRLSVEACLASAAEGSPRTSDPKPVWRDLSETNPPPAGPGDGTFVIRIRILCILHVSCMYSACILMCPVIYIKIHFRYMYLSLWPS